MTIFHIFDAYQIRGQVLCIVTLYRVSKQQHRLNVRLLQNVQTYDEAY